MNKKIKKTIVGLSIALMAVGFSAFSNRATYYYFHNISDDPYSVNPLDYEYRPGTNCHPTLGNCAVAEILEIPPVPYSNPSNAIVFVQGTPYFIP